MKETPKQKPDFFLKELHKMKKMTTLWADLQMKLSDSSFREREQKFNEPILRSPTVDKQSLITP